ncbi:hypothetical protein LTR01_004265 [Friedmanniomyces endolithicus]|nr:hypothetical protein LTR01_004265 [Friedmanniomyces endolithicus]KAK0826381.1 hypothetical protein LTR73_006245 [Friedmanniomyces endolithicus]
MSSVGKRGATLPDRVHKPARSKTGCLICVRRKVRCNEERPRCSHCERLNLQCTWRAGVAASVSQDQPDATSTTQHHEQARRPSASGSASAGGYDGLIGDFDFNNSIWHDTSMLDWSFPDAALDLPSASGTHDTGPVDMAGTPRQTDASHGLHNSLGTPLQAAGTFSPASSTETGGHALVEHFLASVVPPILSSVEVGPRWTSTKMLLASLAGSSPMVRLAMMAFSALECDVPQDSNHSEHRKLYDKAAQQYATHAGDVSRNPAVATSHLAHGLATAFFLAYSDLVTNRVRDAQGVLKEAARMLGQHRDQPLSTVERRLVAWIRLVDGRASSAGADGSFLAETDKTIDSPSTAEKPSFDEPSSDPSPGGSTVEDVLFDVLYAPGLAFYQRVQSIMARVSNIDPWHRARGTVLDETEVMAVAANITKDLRTLEAQRPALMDHAVSGALTERHISVDIATAITRSYRVYWANYQAGHIHLHRVAYKHLPPTVEVLDARATIKRTARLLEQTGEQLPVNFIWPLLMACCEEEDLAERAWMIQSIRNMQSQASNAKPIADVLEEVHRRQDATKQRADVRQTSLDLFNMSFAVV